MALHQMGSLWTVSQMSGYQELSLPLWALLVCLLPLLTLTLLLPPEVGYILEPQGPGVREPLWKKKEGSAPQGHHKAHIYIRFIKVFF